MLPVRHPFPPPLYAPSLSTFLSLLWIRSPLTQLLQNFCILNIHTSCIHGCGPDCMYACMYKAADCIDWMWFRRCLVRQRIYRIWILLQAKCEWNKIKCMHSAHYKMCSYHRNNCRPMLHSRCFVLLRFVIDLGATKKTSDFMLFVQLFRLNSYDSATQRICSSIIEY